MTNPCYNEKTKTDCPDRKPGCAGSCERWREYEKIRNEGYKEKAKAYTSIPFNADVYDKKIKVKLRNRSNPRKHE